MRRWMKEMREKKGLTLKQAGSEIGVSESYYKLIEDGARQKRLDMSMAERIGKLFDLSLAKISQLEENNGFAEPDKTA